MSGRSKLAQAYYDLATMLDAGLPILRSFDVVIEGRRGRFRRVFARIRESICQGSTLADSMNEHPRVFSDLDRMVMDAAERSGSMGESFKMLSQWHEFVHRITRRIQAGMIYPFLILHIAGLIIPFPNLVLGQISFGGYLLEAFRIVLVLYIPTLIVVGLILAKNRTPLLREFLDALVLRIPVLGPAMYHMCICRYARSFSMLFKAGVPITECTQRATRAIGNVSVAAKFNGAVVSVAQGGTLWQGLSRRLPAEYRHLWQVGEETGDLDKASSKVAEMSAERADLYFTEFARWLPRIVYFMVVMILAVRIVQMASQIWNFSALDF